MTSADINQILSAARWLVMSALLTLSAADTLAQEAREALIGKNAADVESETGDAPVAPGSGPRHDIVKGTGPNAVVPPVRPTPPTEVPAKALFGAQRTAAPLAARAIGFYSRGCLAGGVAMDINGPAWQVMRLSRNRNWGHPELISLLSRFAVEAKADGWPGLLVGDISQPRGGPMLTGHASHQIGLDADIWFTPMPNRELTRQEREDMSAVSMLAQGHLAVDPNAWTPKHVALVKRAAEYANVERVLVHPAIKKALCDATAANADRKWLSKVRPVWGHFYHFHIRLKCPANVSGCTPQPPPEADDGCGKELEDWYKRLTAPPRPVDPNAPKPKPIPPLTLDQLPQECRLVLSASVPEAKPAVPPVPGGAKAPAEPNKSVK
ncbi:MAG TPA: penicillin-insensitive murein endopeptidase [Hyphomicrobiaceae bacterium]|nr:penicillin-insensitive murein endopeptidase [Hyphomicrobiaceae bacterium]